MKNLITIVFFCSLLFTNNKLKAEIKIAYIDMELILNNSIAGKKLTENLNKISLENQNYFKQKEEDFKNQELKIISQRNILDNSELESKLKKLREEVTIYNQEKNKRINNFNKKKIQVSELLFKAIKPLLIKYSNENSISIFLQKKNIVIGKSELNKTEDLLKIVDKEITEIKFN